MDNLSSSPLLGIPHVVTPGQLRAARAFLRLGAAELAAKAQVSRNTIINFENEKTTANPSTVAAIQRALEAAGVEFIDGGVKLRSAG